MDSNNPAVSAQPIRTPIAATQGDSQSKLGKRLAVYAADLSVQM